MPIPTTRLGPIWIALPAVLTLVLVNTSVEYPLDYWHHAVTGRLIDQQFVIPTTDTFTCTIGGEPITNQNWLADWIVFEIQEAGGFALAQLCAALLYAGAVLLVTMLGWLRGRNALVAGLVGVGALAVVANNLGVRPQAFSALLFAAEFFILAYWPKSSLTVFGVAVVAILWTNTHGAFPLAVVLPLVFLAGSIAQRLGDGLEGLLQPHSRIHAYAICSVVAAGAIFVNPAPSKTIDYVTGVAARSADRQIEEWQPPHWGEYTGVMLLTSLPVAAAAAWYGRRRLSLGDWLLLLAFGGLACTAQRMAIWWGLLLPGIVAPALAMPQPRRRGIEKRPATDSRAALVFAIALGVLALFTLPWLRYVNPLLPAAKRAELADDDPRNAIAALVRMKASGNVFCPMEWGAYVCWHLGDEAKVFIDGRLDFFPDEVWDEYVTLGTAQDNWQELLEKYEIRWVLWDKRLGEQLPNALSALPREWDRVYDDPLAVVYRLATAPADDMPASKPPGQSSNQ